MGHEIVVYRDRHAIIPDLDFWVLRHLVLAEAEASGQSDVATFVRGWEWVGVGVYVGVDLESFFDGDASRAQRFVELLSAARRRIASLGTLVPLDDIAANINLTGAGFTAPQPVERWVQQIEALRNLFTEP